MTKKPELSADVFTRLMPKAYSFDMGGYITISRFGNRWRIYSQSTGGFLTSKGDWEPEHPLDYFVAAHRLRDETAFVKRTQFTLAGALTRYERSFSRPALVKPGQRTGGLPVRLDYFTEAAYNAALREWGEMHPRSRRGR